MFATLQNVEKLSPTQYVETCATHLFDLESLVPLNCLSMCDNYT